jgi:hypothetical protein
VNRDIVVWTYDGDLQSRLTIHDGTARYADELRIRKQIYRSGAFLPRGQFRNPSAEEVAALAYDRASGNERNRLIGILKLSSVLLDDLRAAKVDEGKISASALEEYPFTGLRAELSPHWIVRGRFLALGFAGNPPGFHTVTFDATASRFIGLHIDDLDELPIVRREESTNRLCVNLGEHARYLLFINVSALNMVRMLSGSLAGDPYIRMRSTPLIHAFLNAFPDYPVARLEVGPGEAYLAPTENMIHDGSTFGMAGMDEQVTVRGIIDPVF